MIEHTINGINLITGSWPLEPGLPTIIFIHGAGNSGMFWKEQVRGLTDICNTVAIDLPGHGRSGGDGRTSISGYAYDVRAAADALQAHKPVVCGLSMGGAVALQLLIDEPQRYSAGILINSGARLKVLPTIFDAIMNDYPGYVRSLASFAASPKTDPAALADMLSDAGKCRPSVAAGDFSACNAFDCMAQLGAISVPVLVLTAGDDRLSPSKYGAYLAANIRNSKTAHIADAGHMSPVEKPEEVNAAIRGFISMFF